MHSQKVATVVPIKPTKDNYADISVEGDNMSQMLVFMEGSVAAAELLDFPNVATRDYCIVCIYAYRIGKRMLAVGSNNTIII
jgi:hypothetical protein